LLEVVVFPAPKCHAEPTDRTQARDSAKPAVSYGWDWHPRLIPLGIWEDTFLEKRPVGHLRDAETSYALCEDLSIATVTMVATATPAALYSVVRWILTAPGGGELFREKAQVGPDGTARLKQGLAHPALWWPHDHGAPALHTSTVELFAADGRRLGWRTQRVGFRRVRLVMYEGAWREPATFPVSRNHPPITVEINGRAIFAKGSNWVNPEIFPGIITAETYRPLLRLARDAHFNLLRCWGGAPVNKEAFFDQCDELGLLVWQEFPLACNRYSDDPRYLRVLDQESRSILRRGRRHACRAIWCGGNELFNAWSGMTDQALPLRLLNRNCYELDPDTPFLPTAPIDGMGHGDYRFRDDRGREVFEIYSSAARTAYSEFGCPGPAPIELLKTIIPAGDLFPPRMGTAWETHHGLGAWEIEPTGWLCLDTQRHYFGEAISLEDLVARGAWLQSEGYRCIFEEARRQKPRCSMALNWCYNEPWPTAANNSLLSWPAQPKPAYAAVAAACRPVLASARLAKFSWTGGETFSIDLWLLNDSDDDLPPGEVTAAIEIAGEAVPLLAWTHGTVAANRNLAGPGARCTLPSHAVVDRFRLHLRCPAAAERDSSYTLHYRPSGPAAAGGEKSS
jgi:beta-mannosidase